MSLYALERGKGFRDLIIGSNEKSWFSDGPFDSFGHIWPPKLGQNWPKSLIDLLSKTWAYTR